jgi:hypothetical protein
MVKFRFYLIDRKGGITGVTMVTVLQVLAVSVHRHVSQCLSVCLSAHAVSFWEGCHHCVSIDRPVNTVAAYKP